MEESITNINALLAGMGEGALNMGWRIVSALAVLALGYCLKQLIRRLIKRLMDIKVRSRAVSESRVRSLSAFMLAVYDFAAWFIIAVSALSQLGVDVTSLLTVAGVGGIAIGLGAQTLVKDMLAGLLFFLEDQYQPGDIIKVGEICGEVERMTLRLTEIREFSGDLHVIPNGEIRAVTNSTRSFHRAIVDLSVDYGEPLDEVMQVLGDELGRCYPEVEGLTAAPVCLGVTRLADSGVELRVAAECAVKQHWAVERELRRRIKNRFDAEGIELSLPQVVVHSGGKT